MCSSRASATVCRIRRLTAAMLLASVANAALADAALANNVTASATAQPAGQLGPDILVIGERMFRDIFPERSLDQGEIEGYGSSTIDELLNAIQSELGEDGELPLIIVDGQRINSISEIGDLPIEAVRNIQVLPRGAAVKAGGRSGQRVVNINLRKSVRSVTLSTAPRIATDGQGKGLRGEAIYTFIRGKMRANLSLRGRGEDALFEADRDIVQRDSAFPYALGGNVSAYPDLTGEIDPLLSGLAGQLITVAPIPAGASPTLADFASGVPNLTDLGRFRTLRPETRTLELNGSLRAPLTSWLTSSATLRLGRNTGESLRGLPTGLFRLSPDNPASPFSRDVRLAYYGARPLQNRTRRLNGEASFTLDAAIGTWTGDLNAKHSRFSNLSRSERQAGFGLIAIDDLVNPFATSVESLLGITTSSAASRSRATRLQMNLNGPAAELPAGAVQATLEAQLAWHAINSESTFTSAPARRARRAEQAIRGALDIPLLSRGKGFLPLLGELSATVELGRLHFSDVKGTTQYSAGLTWEPIESLRLRAAIERTGTPPPVELLASPVIINPDTSIFDPLTGETVAVAQFSGGNPGLELETVTVRRLTGLLRLVPRLKLNLNAEYADTSRNNFVSSLPEASAAVMLAFPDRFVRNPGGILTAVDLRPVNFDEAEEQRFRWGFSMNSALGAARRGTAAGARGARPRPTMVQLTANHTMVLSEQILIRPGLDPINLLNGGAIGIGGGRVRHQIDGTVSVTSGGTGVRIGGNWRGPGELQTRISGETDTLRFSPLLKLNLRAFTDVQRFTPGSAWAKGLRLSLDILNITNDRQEVFNSLGDTPLQYQPGYRDPIGRTIEFEIRKVF